MSGHTVTTLAFVRTEAGVVKVDPDDIVPTDLVDGELERLVVAGVIVEQTPTATPPAPKPPKGGQGS